MTIRTFAEAEAVLASTLPGYESRPPQQQLAAFVEGILENGGQGLAEAGCGTGKSLATLIPAILRGKKAVVATATIALMEQYANKDVPFLQEHLGVPFTWALLKGRANYYCYAKAASADPTRVPNLAAMQAELADEEHSGDREHFECQPSREEFREVSSTSQDCPGKRECPFGDICFAEKAKEKAAASQVVITNTAMLMTDLVVRELTEGFATMLGPYEAVAIDEAHELEEYATNALSFELREAGLRKLVTEIQNFAAAQDGPRDLGFDVLDNVAKLWAALPDVEKSTVRIDDEFLLNNQDAFVGLIGALSGLSDQVHEIKVVRGGERQTAKRASLATRANNYVMKLETMLLDDSGELVNWVERTEVGRKREVVKVIKSSPISVAPFLTRNLWDPSLGISSVLVSATLSVNGDFGYIKDRLGLDGASTMCVGTPFDYASQALLFVPGRGIVAPNKDRSSWLSYCAAATTELIEAAGGGALLLFTSRSAMETAFNTYGQRIAAKGHRVLMQGQDYSNKELARIFQEDTRSVLFALKSFFTGVDFAGDTCRLVVIDKLPFPVPTEPMYQARCEQIEKARGNSFADLTIPMMTLTLNQAFGRLIRSRRDTGVVAILDSRLSSTGYGQRIVRTLPDSPATTDLGTVQAFYASARGRVATAG